MVHHAPLTPALDRLIAQIEAELKVCKEQLHNQMWSELSLVAIRRVIARKEAKLQILIAARQEALEEIRQAGLE